MSHSSSRTPPKRMPRSRASFSALSIGIAISLLSLLSPSVTQALPIASGSVGLEGFFAYRNAGTGCETVAATIPTVVARSISVVPGASDTGFDSDSPGGHVLAQSTAASATFSSSGQTEAFVLPPTVIGGRCEPWGINGSLEADVSNLLGSRGIAQNTEQLAIILEKRDPTDDGNIFDNGITFSLGEILLSGDQARSSFILHASDNSIPLLDLELVTPTKPGDPLIVRDTLSDDVTGSVGNIIYDAATKTYHVLGGSFFWQQPFASPLQDTLVFRVTATIAMPEPHVLVLLATALGAFTLVAGGRGGGLGHR